MAASFSSMYESRRTMLLSRGLPLTVQREVTSNETAISSSAASSSTN